MVSHRKGLQDVNRVTDINAYSVSDAGLGRVQPVVGRPDVLNDDEPV